MRSRGDPAQLQPGSHTGTPQVAFSSVFLERRTPSYVSPVCEGDRRGVVLLSAGHGFLEGHRWFRRPSHVIGAKTRVSGHLKLSPRGTVGPILGKPLLRMLSALLGGNQLRPALL